MKQLDERYQIDDLAEQTGGYFAMPSQDEMTYTELLFDGCQQFGILYYFATKRASLRRGSDARNLGKTAGGKTVSGRISVPPFRLDPQNRTN